MITSRDFAEYVAMFQLTEQELLEGPVLDCAAGASDFARHARTLGATAVSVDPLYRETPQRLRERLDTELDLGERRAHEVPELYDVAWMGGLDTYLARRRATAAAFIADYTGFWGTGPGSPYVPAELPDLPFRDGEFRLGLVPNLLFAYANLFDRSWHRAALTEMLRVCHEVRVHPTTDTAGRPYPELDPLLAELAQDGVRHRIVDVDYRLRRDPGRTLRCWRGDGTDN